MLSRFFYDALAPSQDSAPEGELQRFFRHFLALTSTKIADGLINPKLVLAWMLGAIGAPGFFIGSLVPVREAGALLPQILLARAIQRTPVRKYFWAAGSCVQGLSALGIALACLTLEGAAAGWAVLLCLAVLSLARASCSASYKDILARTLQKGTRGTVSGTAGTVAATMVFGVAILLSFDIIALDVQTLSIVVALAGLLWIGGAVVFLGLRETPDENTQDQGQGVRAIVKPIFEDSEFRQYVLVRGLLIATALAPPFLVMLSNEATDGSLGNLGFLLIASSLAAIVSSYVWGRLSDTSSRLTLIFAGLISASALAVAAVLGFVTGGAGNALATAALLFVAQIGYEGVRAGRKTHLTDLDSPGEKANYTALSNTMIGVLLLLGGGFGVLADIAGAATVLAIFALLSLLGALSALALSEVQQD